MKITRTDLEQINNYYKDSSISQSMLKKFLTLEEEIDFINKNIRKEEPLKEELYYEEKDYMLLGKLVDTMVTNKKEDFNKIFYTSNIDIPGDKVLSICKYVYDVTVKSSMGETMSSTLEEYSSLLEQAITSHNYQGNWKMETRIRKVVEEGSAYFAVLVASSGKIIIDEATHMKATYIAKQIENYLSYVIRDLLCMDKDYVSNKIFFQLPIMVNGKKGLLDIVIVDELHKQIYVLDLKVISGTYDSVHRFIRKYRVDIQFAYYKHLLDLSYNDCVGETNRDITNLLELENTYSSYQKNYLILYSFANTPDILTIKKIDDLLLEGGKEGITEKRYPLYTATSTKTKEGFKYSVLENSDINSCGVQPRIIGFLGLIDKYTILMNRVANNPDIKEEQNFRSFLSTYYSKVDTLKTLTIDEVFYKY